MTETMGRRERKKREIRERIANAAARLFAEQGYDAVSMVAVAVAAGVAEQTVYNHFPTKPDLVLDLADEMLESARRAVADRGPLATPADALRLVVHGDIDHFVTEDPLLARGEYPAQSVESEVLRRYALHFRDEQAEALAEVIRDTDPELNPLVVRAHASALVTVLQAITDRVGAAILSGSDLDSVTEALHRDADVALADAAANFRAAKARAAEARAAEARAAEVAP
ncbi:TetR/AcrR family transcriptional regulator [Frigoribacterium sp. 2-23]|uniref:TetR/AcrR family transcriptional regulator n=1 Tax=Frigoribacterium sp. 2-23 TaxID=3415006 RepID=UPI003C701BAC